MLEQEGITNAWPLLLQSQKETETVPLGSRDGETILYIVQEEFDLSLLHFDALVFALMLRAERNPVK